MALGRKTVVAIPVRNEEHHLDACLDALREQSHPADAVILLLNNCSDGSAGICRCAGSSWPALRIVECRLDGNDASAGEARRLAIEYAMAEVGDGVILTTDADSIVPPGWIADNFAEIADGADCVCGMAVVSHQECGGNRPRLAFDDMRETLLLALQDEIAAILDPDPADPWPRHQQHSGASIAVLAGSLRRAGGAPRVAVGEDRALVAKLALVDARIRHSPRIQVTVSGRLQGRAAGGMADTMRRRVNCLDWLTDDRLEPTVDAYRRVLMRARLRTVFRGEEEGDRLAKDLILSRLVMDDALDSRFFGTAWARIERESAVLHRRRVAFADLARETRQALALLEHVRGAAAPVGARFRHAV